MKLGDLSYTGTDEPFEGDRTLWLRCLPTGAQVRRAVVKLEPAQAADDIPITFDASTGRGDWGATRLPASPTFWAIADLHAQRTITGIRASREAGNNLVMLEVDVGGTWLPIAADGTFKVSPDQQRLVVSVAANTTTVLPALTTAKLKLTACDANGNPQPAGTVSLHGLTLRTIPTNVSVRLGDLPPVWTHSGELGTPQSSPDFAFVFNAFLAEAGVRDGFYTVPLVVHSDTIARLNLTLSLDYVVEQALLPPHLPEVTLPYSYSTLPEMPVDLALRAPRGARIVSTSGTLQGTFGPSRVMAGQLMRQEQATDIEVDPTHSLAQPIRLDAETPVSSIDLALANTAAGLAGVYLALQEDADGEPAGVELISVPVQVSKPVPGGTAWGSAALPAEFRFSANERYWLVLQSVTGTARWEAQPDAGGMATLLVSADGGRSWRPAASTPGAAPLAALYRLRYAPTQFSIPVHLQIDRQPELVHFDRYAPLGRVEFELDIAKELDAFMNSAAAAPACGSGELISNGDFQLPEMALPTDDSSEDGAQCCAEIPDAWQGVRGRVLRYRTSPTHPTWAVLVAAQIASEAQIPELYKDCFDDITLQALTGDPAVLTQRVPVHEECSYLLSVHYAAFPSAIDPYANEQPAPRWEFVWFDAKGALIGRKATNIDFEARKRLKLPINSWFQTHEVSLTAPPTAVQVEIRLIQQATGILVLAECSFTPTNRVLANGAFQDWQLVEVGNREEKWPTHWQLESGLEPDAVTLQRQVIGVCLGGHPTAETVLTQRVAIRGGSAYELRVQALAAEPVEADDEPPIAERARLELTWQTDDAPVAAPVTLLLDERTLGALSWAGNAPTAANQATIRIIQPPGPQRLLVGQVVLMEVDQTEAPLTFLAEAPGELTLSDPRVTYDPPPPPLTAGLLPGDRCRSQEPATPAPHLASLPVSAIDGIGETNERYLAAASPSIRTIGELAALDPQIAIASIGAEKLLSFKAAAEEIIAADLSEAPFAALGDATLAEVIAMEQAELAARSGPGSEAAEEFQARLDVLAARLDKQVLSELRLRDLL